MTGHVCLNCQRLIVDGFPHICNTLNWGDGGQFSTVTDPTRHTITGALTGKTYTPEEWEAQKATRDAEQAVAEAREKLEPWLHGGGFGLDYLNAYEAAVRQAERAKIEAEHIERDTVNFAAMLASERRIATLAERARLRGIVEGMPGLEDRTVGHHWLAKASVLAALSSEGT